MTQATNDKDLEFTNLKSDMKLRSNVKILTFENPSDEKSVGLILKQKGLCDSQRQWLETLVKRNGAKFVEDLKPKNKSK